MRDVHEELAALAPAYALDALDPAEREVFESHLSHCASCAADVRAFTRVAASVGWSVPSATPRADVRQRLLDRIATTAASQPVLRRTSGSRGAVVAAWGSIAALLAMALGLGLYAATLRVRVADLQARLEQETSRRLIAERALTTTRGAVVQTQAALDVLLAPDLARIDLAGQAAAPSARALALWSRQRGMVFTASNLPQLPAGRTYQVWVVTAHAKLSAGLIAPDARGGVRNVFATPPDIEPPVAVAVTLEPAGGVPQPTGAFYLLGAVKS